MNSQTEKVQFTPGPWKHEAAFPTSVWANHVWVASTNVETIRSMDEREANARLIAACPTMYEALKETVRVMRCNPQTAAIQLLEAIEQAEAAIAAAEGKE